MKQEKRNREERSASDTTGVIVNSGDTTGDVTVV